MEILQLSTLQSVFLIIVAVAISLFFVLAAALAIAGLLVVSKVKKVISKAEEAIDSVEEATETIKTIGAQAGGPLAMFKVVKGIVDVVNKRSNMAHTHKKSNNIVKKIAIGTAIAGAAGYVSGVLNAPKEGKKTRKQLKKTAEHNIADLEKQLKELHSEMGSLMANAKKQSDKTLDKGDKKFRTAINNASGAKDKLRHVISSIHEGEATDKDLGKALEDAKRSLEHLKNFIKK